MTHRYLATEGAKPWYGLTSGAKAETLEIWTEGHVVFRKVKETLDDGTVYMKEIQTNIRTALPNYDMKYVDKAGYKIRALYPAGRFDARFPSHNGARKCYQNYLDFHRCRKLRGEDYTPCEYYRRNYLAFCYNEKIEKWDNEIEEGCFAGNIGQDYIKRPH